MNSLAIATGEIIDPSAAPLTLFDDYIKFIDRGEATTRAYITNLRQFAAWMHYNGIARPQREDIMEYRRYLGEEHPAIKLDPTTARGWSYRTDRSGRRLTIRCSANTVKQYLQSICQFFRWTAANGLYPNIAENIHAPKVRQDAHKKDALTAAEVLTIEESITALAQSRRAIAETAHKDPHGRMERATEQGKRLYAMYLLAVNCGLRTIELSRANIADLEYKNGTGHLYIWGKGHSEADTKKILAPEVAEALADYIKCRTDAKGPNSPLFVSTGNRSGGKRIASTTISKLLKGALKDAGYNSARLTAHSLRHTAGTNAMELTGNLYQAQQYMRHANPATTEIYLHNDSEAAEENIARRLYNLYHGKEDTATRLDEALRGLSAAQLEQLATIATAMGGAR